MIKTLENKNLASDSIFLKWLDFFKRKLQFITITNLILNDRLIFCSYNLSFATRMHHLPVIDQYQLPNDIISSFIFKYLPDHEKDFLLACKACNDTIAYFDTHPENEIMKFSTGKEIIILIYDPKNRSKKMEFKIDDLSKFTGLCRRYRSPTEVEKIIAEIFRIKKSA